MRPLGRGTRALTALASLVLGHLPLPVVLASLASVQEVTAGPVLGGFASSNVSLSLDARAAEFSVPITPTPTVIRRGVNMHLSWQAVTISSGDPVRYWVVRQTPNATPVEVCTGADSPVTSGTLVTCIDRKPGQSGAYSVQAHVVSSSGTTTWSLPASPSVSA